MSKIPEYVPDPNPPIVKWTRREGILEKETTHAIPRVNKESFQIEHAQAHIDKIDVVIAMWEAKKVPYQEIIDKYEELAQ